MKISFSILSPLSSALHLSLSFTLCSSLNFTFCLSLSYDGELSVGTHLDDAAWLMLFFALAVVFDNIIEAVFANAEGILSTQ